MFHFSVVTAGKQNIHSIFIIKIVYLILITSGWYWELVFYWYFQKLLQFFGHFSLYWSFLISLFLVNSFIYYMFWKCKLWCVLNFLPHKICAKKNFALIISSWLLAGGSWWNVCAPKKSLSLHILSRSHAENHCCIRCLELSLELSVRLFQHLLTSNKMLKGFY